MSLLNVLLDISLFLGSKMYFYNNGACDVPPFFILQMDRSYVLNVSSFVKTAILRLMIM